MPTARSLRIGQVAEQTGTTPRTIRYYEEIGLLPGIRERSQGQHRSYTEEDVARIREVMRLRDLLGLPLEQLVALVEAEEARAELRREYAASEDPAVRIELLTRAQPHLKAQLALVRDRLQALRELESELQERQRVVGERLAELQGPGSGAAGPLG